MPGRALPQEQELDRICSERRKSASTPFPLLRDVPLFEKMLSINGLGDILAVESGYEEGCKRGARQKPTDFSRSVVNG